MASPVPLVSVITTVCNGARHLRAAIASVLGQTLTDFEFLVVDDGSTDETATILASTNDSRMRVIRLPRSVGPFAAANLALDEARAPFIARMDADDVSAPERLAAQVRWLEVHPEVGLLGTAARIIDDAGQPVRNQRVPRGADLPLRCVLEPPFVHSSVLWRASAGLRYDGQLRVGGDHELWSRALITGGAENLETALVDYRVWSQNLSSTARPEQQVAQRRAGFAFLRAKWPEVEVTEARHERLRSDPSDTELINRLIRASGGSRETLTAPLGTLGQPSPLGGAT